MDMQLELLPYHYYNTLDFDVELIDYINLVDDFIMRALYRMIERIIKHARDIILPKDHVGG